MNPGVIVITGASGGIGQALARRYARPAVVLALLARNKEKLQQLAKVCEKSGATVVTASLDIRDSEALQHWLHQFNRQYPVDLLIANAGVTSSLGNQGEPESWEAIRRVLDTNLTGVLASIYPLIQPMRQRQQGHIAIISSLAAYRGLPITPAYCASKAAIKAYGEALRGWLAADGIQVSVILPGFVESDMSRQFPGHKPFLISANTAARRIQQGLAKNRAYIAFPFLLHLGSQLLALLPASLGDRVVHWMSYGAYRSCGKK